MVIDFNKIEETEIPKFKGGEKSIHSRTHLDDMNRIMLSRLEPGASIGMHVHDTSSEMIYFLSGSGKVIEDSRETPVSAGQCNYCPKGCSHSVVNDSDEDLIFFAVVPQQ